MKILAVLAAAVCPVVLDATSTPLSPGIEDLYRLDRLPALRESIKVGSVSSYDRTGGNDDGFSGKFSFIRKDPRGLVIADLQGPGVIYRIHTPTPGDAVIEFYFDGEEKPRIAVPFRDVFTGKREPFVRPLVGFGAGGFFSYVPLPFARSCAIIVKAERVQFYQINYAVYPAGAPVKTFDPVPSPDYLAARRRACDLFASAGSDISASCVANSQSILPHRSRHSLEPGATRTIFQATTGGRIAGIRLSPAASLAGKERAIVLRASWDGDPTPAIHCPAGDLFGYAWGQPAVTSLLFGTSGDTNYLYFPMPFDSSAKVELVDQRATGDPLPIVAEVLFAPLPRAAGEGKFYALWRRENPTEKGKPFTFVATEGRGHIVGCTQQSQGLESGNTYFFEGDDQTWIDGELAIPGTGSEDFYNGGWYDVPGRWETRRSFPLSGCLAYQKHLGRTGGYRLMIGDAYAYRKEIRHTIEHAPTGNELLNDYCGVTFLYSESRPTCSFDLPPLPGRAVVDLKKLIFSTWWNVPIHAWSFQNATLARVGEKLDGKDLRFLSLRAEGGDFFGDPFISFVCELPAAGTYRVGIEAARGPAQGRVQLFMDEAPVGDAVDCYAPQREHAPELFLGRLELKEGDNNLLFKLVGKNEKASGMALDVRSIICERTE